MLRCRSTLTVAAALFVSIAGHAAAQPRLQTPAGAVAAEPAARPARTSGRSFSSYTRLARAPHMFGDSPILGQMVIANPNEGTTTTDLPIGGGRLQKVAENNSPLPADRVYFVYNGFQNAVSTSVTSPGGTTVAEDFNLNRYTIGFEKTFFDGWWSLDVRMPFTDDFEFADDGFAIDSGNFGDLTMFLKHLVYDDEVLAAAIGLGVGLPTGSNVDGRIDTTPFAIQNETVHLLPYIGVLVTPNEDWFFQSFVQLDFATDGNDVIVGDQRSGTYTEQNLLHVDLSAGRWLHRNDYARYFLGTAAMVELHYTTSLQDADAVDLVGGPFGQQFGEISNPINRFDILNLTAGLHFQLTEMSNLRVGAVVPLRADPDRQFDSEIQVSFNRFF